MTRGQRLLSFLTRRTGRPTNVHGDLLSWNGYGLNAREGGKGCTSPSTSLGFYIVAAGLKSPTVCVELTANTGEEVQSKQTQKQVADKLVSLQTPGFSSVSESALETCQPCKTNPGNGARSALWPATTASGGRAPGSWRWACRGSSSHAT